MSRFPLTLAELWWFTSVKNQLIVSFKAAYISLWLWALHKAFKLHFWKGRNPRQAFCCKCKSERAISQGKHDWFCFSRGFSDTQRYFRYSHLLNKMELFRLVTLCVNICPLYCVLQKVATTKHFLWAQHVKHGFPGALMYNQLFNKQGVHKWAKGYHL